MIKEGRTQFVPDLLTNGPDLRYQKIHVISFAFLEFGYNGISAGDVIKFGDYLALVIYVDTSEKVAVIKFNKGRTT